MAAAPPFKVYNHRGEYMAACKELEAALDLLSFYGPGSTARYGHKAVLWRQGADGGDSLSYDDKAEIIRSRNPQWWPR